MRLMFIDLYKRRYRLTDAILAAIHFMVLLLSLKNSIWNIILAGGTALKPLKNFSKQALTASREVGLQLCLFSKRHFFRYKLSMVGNYWHVKYKKANHHFALHSFDWLMFFVVVQQKYQQSQYFYCSLTMKGTKENYCVYTRSYSPANSLATLFWVNQC